tara:strand:- start:7 stop:492 length:486 start_codon:yes stop_codon:yes gene_type:complete
MSKQQLKELVIQYLTNITDNLDEEKRKMFLDLVSERKDDDEFSQEFYAEFEKRKKEKEEDVCDDCGEEDCSMDGLCCPEAIERTEKEEEEEGVWKFRPQTRMGECEGCKMICEECERLQYNEEEEEEEEDKQCRDCEIEAKKHCDECGGYGSDDDDDEEEE